MCYVSTHLAIEATKTELVLLEMIEKRQPEAGTKPCVSKQKRGLSYPSGPHNEGE